MRRRSSLRRIASISLMAEGLIRTLYLPTLFEVFQNFFERQIRFVSTLLKCSQILCVLGQMELYRFIDQI